MLHLLPQPLLLPGNGLLQTGKLHRHFQHKVAAFLRIAYAVSVQVERGNKGAGGGE